MATFYFRNIIIVNELPKARAILIIKLGHLANATQNTDILPQTNTRSCRVIYKKVQRLNKLQNIMVIIYYTVLNYIVGMVRAYNLN